MQAISKNKTLTVITSLLRTLCLFGASSTLFQTFLATVGFNEGQIYLHATLVQAVTVGTILLFSHYADGKRPILRSALVQIPNGLLYLALIPFCFRTEGGSTAFVLLTAVSLLQGVCTALHTVCTYKLPYLLYRATDCSKVEALAGVLAATVTFGMGELMHFLQSRVAYTRLALYAFLFSSALMVAAGGLTLFLRAMQREIPKEPPAIAPTETEGEERKEARISVLSLVRRPVFYLLVPANLLRGFASGVVAVLATVALTLGHGTEITTRMVSFSAVSSFLGCLVFGLITRIFSPRIPVFFGCACFLLLPLCLSDSSAWFLFAYAVVYFGRSMVDVGVPSLLVYAVDAQIAGPYNAWRMILHNGGTMLATAIAPFLSPAALLIAATLASLLAGVSFLTLRLLRRASPTFVRGKPHLFR